MGRAGAVDEWAGKKGSLFGWDLTRVDAYWNGSLLGWIPTCMGFYMGAEERIWKSRFYRMNLTDDISVSTDGKL